ncbi:MAG: hypothetical protein BGO41_15300 [Clostridiales bacterium 38-18]|nr:MAG: hypothetical protein BGO41_15300 [Clostridiales bacterium 38-18]
MKRIKEVLIILFFGFYLYIASIVTYNYSDNLLIESIIGATLVGMLGYTMSLVFSRYSKKDKLIKRLAVASIFLVLFFVQQIVLK